MIVSPIDHPTPISELILGPENESATPRSTGTLHLSTIYRDLCKSALLDRHRNGDVTEEELAFYGAGGFMWEWVFSMAYARAFTDREVIRTDEWELDGIVGSPDGVRVDPYRVVETKFRWMSSNKLDALERYFWPELVQMKSYCHMIGSTEAELHVYFVNGDYKPPIPTVRSLLLDFTPEELDDNWNMVRSHAERRGWL